jgi:hypothetical protein
MQRYILRVILMVNDMIFLGDHGGLGGLPIGVFLVGVPLTCDIAPQFVEGSVAREESDDRVRRSPGCWRICRFEVILNYKYRYHEISTGR